jgi:hypothetical protein
MDKLGDFEGEVAQAIEDEISFIRLQGYYLTAISIYKRWPSEMSSILNSILTTE